jgi:hypothetical protein
LSSGSLRVAAAFVGVAVLASAPARAEGKCSGTKQWYAGKCRYPDDIAKLKTEQEAQRRAAEQRRAEEQWRKEEAEAKRQAEEAEARARAEAEKADTAACKNARRDDTADSWRGYIENFPTGKCREDATDRIEALKSKPQPPAPQPEEPEPKPKPPPRPMPAPPSLVPRRAEEKHISPVAWTGFALGAAGFLIGGITGGVAASKTSALRAACPNKVCDPSKRGDLDGTKKLADVSTGMFVIGGLGAAAGVVGLAVPI